MSEKVFKFKLDFYYKSIIIYFIFLIVYSVIRGNFSEERFYIVFKDPIIYITVIFIIITLISLIVNALRNKQIIFLDDRIVFKNRFGKREIFKEEIINIKFSKERGKEIDGDRKIRLVKLKLKNRKRWLRIRITDYYDERKLIKEFKLIKHHQ
ncbi:MAG: hypothetical protein N2490_03325 [Ignavibacteria bacterium]|nr:hypothetical protein [Ignavibacteria bacterium]